MITFVLKPRPPFRLDLTVWTLRRRSENLIDRWEDGVYRRVLAVGTNSALVEIRQISPSATPRLKVRVHSDRELPALRPAVTVAIERLLGIRLDMQAFYNFAAHKPKLDALALRFRGMKPPRFLTGFECLMNAIACQQISLAAGIQILNRFATAFGVPFVGNRSGQHAFPRPQDLIHANQDQLRRLGFSRQKSIAVLALAQSIRESVFDLDALRTLPDETCVAELCRLHGIGRWSAEYAMLRGLGRLHVFPGDDVGARNNLTKWLELSGKLDYDRVQHELRHWKPFRGLIYLHLLLNKLASGGLVQPSTTV